MVTKTFLGFAGGVDYEELDRLLGEHDEYERERGWYSPDLAGENRSREIARNSRLLGEEVEELLEEAESTGYSEESFAYELADVIMFAKSLGQSLEKGLDHYIAEESGLNVQDGWSTGDLLRDGIDGSFGSILGFQTNISDRTERIGDLYDNIRDIEPRPYSPDGVGENVQDEIGLNTVKIMLEGVEIGSSLQGSFTDYFREKLERNRQRHKVAHVGMNEPDDARIRPYQVILDIPSEATVLRDTDTGESYTTGAEGDVRDLGLSSEILNQTRIVPNVHWIEVNGKRFEPHSGGEQSAST